MYTRALKDKRSKTVQRIIEAATNVFADVGYNGARVDEIAKKAGVNKATIYYHIGDKEALYAQVLHDVTEDAAERIETSVEKATTPTDKLKAYFLAIAQTVDEHPSLAPLMMREVASGGQNLPVVIAEDLVRIYAILTDIMKEGAASGEFVPAGTLPVHLLYLGPLIFHKNLEACWKTNPGVAEVFARLDEEIYRDFGQNIEARAADEILRLVLRAVETNRK
ncbi:MAG: TetR/AcrR family transcriptional regulator [Deltaproteobacteria bacterium]|nr:TetR/AcrR family transcriptional regulator [Deltaproteobacteria bacterium]